MNKKQIIFLSFLIAVSFGLLGVVATASQYQIDELQAQLQDANSRAESLEADKLKLNKFIRRMGDRRLIEGKAGLDTS